MINHRHILKGFALGLLFTSAGTVSAAPAQKPLTEKELEAKSAPAAIPAPPEPLNAMVWGDAVGIFTGLLFAGVDVPLTYTLDIGPTVSRMDVEFGTSEVSGTGFGLHADVMISGTTGWDGWIVGGTILYLPCDFKDKPAGGDTLSGSLAAWGALVTVGYQFEWGPARIRPTAMLAYLSLPSSVNVENGSVTGTVEVTSVRGWLPGAQLLLGFAF